MFEISFALLIVAAAITVMRWARRPLNVWVPPSGEKPTPATDREYRDLEDLWERS